MFTWFFELNNLTQAIFLYFLIINIIAFLFFGMDKFKARLGHRRISERRLLSLAFIGGSAGALLAMNTFRHKTKKLSFQAMLAIILALQVTALILLTL